jgi:ribosomal protein L37E
MHHATPGYSRGEGHPSPPPPESITCPRCGRTSYHPGDIAAGYCGACHDWTSAPLSRGLWQPMPERWPELHPPELTPAEQLAAALRYVLARYGPPPVQDEGGAVEEVDELDSSGVTEEYQNDPEDEGGA